MARFLFKSKLTKQEIAAELCALKDSYKMNLSNDKTRFTIRKYDDDFKYLRRYIFSRRIKGKAVEKNGELFVSLRDTASSSLLDWLIMFSISFVLAFLAFESLLFGILTAGIFTLISFAAFEIQNRIFEIPRNLREELYDIFIRSLKLEEVD